MTVQMSGPLPRSLVIAALANKQPETRRTRGWMRRRGLRPVAAVDVTGGGEVCIDTAADFAACHHPGCCAVRPVESSAKCAVCGGR
jgi:hypothetical protein